MSPQFDDVAILQRANTTRIDYAKEVGKGRATLIVERKKTHASTNTKGCWLYRGSKNTDGYGQIFVKPNSKSHMKGRSAQRAFLLHILSYLSYNSQVDQHSSISHLCGERSCFNPAHLVAESPQKNNSRKGCPGDIKCYQCSTLAYSCLHEPKCIMHKL